METKKEKIGRKKELSGSDKNLSPPNCKEKRKKRLQGSKFTTLPLELDNNNNEQHINTRINGGLNWQIPLNFFYKWILPSYIKF